MSNSIKAKKKTIEGFDLSRKNKPLIKMDIIELEFNPIYDSMNYVNRNADNSLSINLTKKTARDLLNKIKKELDK